jgi:hypothetical protein
MVADAERMPGTAHPLQHVPQKALVLLRVGT